MNRILAPSSKGCSPGRKKERLWTQVDEEIALDELLPHVGDEVGGNGVCAYYDEGKGPAAPMHTSMIQLNADRSRKQMPPLKRVQLGVQMRLTMGVR